MIQGRVHEQIQPTLEATGTPVYTIDATVQHLGFASEAEVARKSRTSRITRSVRCRRCIA